MNDDKRRELIATPVTLNGEPAVIRGRLNESATVGQLDGPLQAEWSWAAAARIVEEGGQFRM